MKKLVLPAAIGARALVAAACGSSSNGASAHSAHSASSAASAKTLDQLVEADSFGSAVPTLPKSFAVSSKDDSTKATSDLPTLESLMK